MSKVVLQQRSLFDLGDPNPDYRPRSAPLFQPRKIILAKGSVSTADRRRRVDGVLAVYPKAEVIEQQTVPHNKVRIEAEDPLDLHYRGHRVLVFGEHQSAVGRSDEEGNTCPNFWHFSPYGFCPYGCSFCSGRYAGRTVLSHRQNLRQRGGDPGGDRPRCPPVGARGGVLPGQTPGRHGSRPAHGLLASDDPLFAQHPYARLRVLSKCADFDNVLDLEHRGGTVLCWSLTPAAVRKDYELVTPPVEDRLGAIRRCAEAGYPVRVMLMPIIPIPDWRRHYDELLEQLLTEVRLDRITLGGICSYGPALQIMEAKLGKDNLISRSLTVLDNPPGDGRTRYPVEMRATIYRHLLDTIRRLQPDLTRALCMEDVGLARDLGVAGNIGRCNCIL